MIIDNRLLNSCVGFGSRQARHLVNPNPLLQARTLCMHALKLAGFTMQHVDTRGTHESTSSSTTTHPTHACGHACRVSHAACMTQEASINIQHATCYNIPWGLGRSAGPGGGWSRPNRNGPPLPLWGLGPPEPQLATVAAAVGPGAARRESQKNH